jgi:hypothetical protein
MCPRDDVTAVMDAIALPDVKGEAVVHGLDQKIGVIDFPLLSRRLRSCPSNHGRALVHVVLIREIYVEGALVCE